MDELTVAVVSCGTGNIASVAHAIELLGGNCVAVDRKQDIEHADAVTLPGVGAFATAMANLRRLDLIGPLEEHALDRKKPFLGICLGMQLLSASSEEQGLHQGLGWVRGKVVKMTVGPDGRLPHVGWNTLEVLKQEPLFTNIGPDAHFYFDHAFVFTDAEDALVAKSSYGEPFIAAIRQENILAVQFHPEKSQRSGLKLLRNFLNFAAAWKE